MSLSSTSSVERAGGHSLYLEPGMARARWSNEDMRLSSTLMTMDATENWTFDGNPETEKALESLCRLLDRAGNEKLIGSAARDFLMIMAYMRSSRAVHILSVMDKKFNGAGLKLVQRASQLKEVDVNGNAIEATLMIERMQTLHRIHALRRIFSPSRLRLVIKAIEEINHEAEY